MIKSFNRPNSSNFGVMLIGALVTAVLLYFSPTSFAATITLDEPLQECIGTNRSVSLSWISDISGNPTFRIMRKLAADPSYSEIAITDALSFVDNNAFSDKSYDYRIKVINGSETLSNVIAAPAIYCPAVFSATEASCKANGPHNRLTWAEVTGNISKYEILRKNVTLGEADFAKIGETTGHSYDDGPNIAGTDTYLYIISSIWQDGTKRDSADVSVDALACPAILNTNASCINTSPGGQKINLSWNSLMGITRYEIYRKAQSEADYSLLASLDPALTAYSDNLIESMPLNYWQSGNINYFVKTVWIKDLEEITKNSALKQIANYHCAPFASTSGMCDASGNPEMHLSWTKTMNSDFYNLFRNDATFLGQYGSTTSSYIDYLSSADCPGAICTHNYKVVSGVTGYPNFTSNTASQSVDCATIVPPSPTPVMNEPEIFCVSGDSRLRLSWTPSENVIYYTLYRNGTSLLNLTNTAYIDSGVEAGSEYTYYVIANGREGTQTAPSLTQTAVASNCIPPTAPNLSLAKSCVSGNPKVSLSWSSTSNTVNYEIKRGLSEAGLSTKAIVSNTTYSWSDTDNLDPSTAYYYQVIANGVLGSAPGYSVVQPITTNSCLPTLPVVTLNNSCAGGNPRVTVNWTSDNANTQNYKVFREDLIPPIATVPVGGIYSVIDPNLLLMSTTYRYKVVGVGFNAGQETSSSYQAVTTSNCSPPGPFTLTDPPSASCQGPYPKVQLDWTNSVNATSYNLVRSVSSPATITGVTSPYNDVGQGNALSFDGINDYARVGSPANLDMTTNDFTIEVWAKANGGTYGRGIVNKGGWGSTGYFISEAYSPNNRYYFGVKDSAGYKTIALSLYETWGWTHIVGIKTNNHLEAWVNGSLVGQYNGTIGNLTNIDKAFDIGRSYNPYYFNGFIGEVRVYRRALSSTEVLEHKNGIFTSEVDLAGLWYLDEGGGQIASDSSNYGKNATLGSAAGADSNDPAWGNNILTKTNYSWKVDAFSLGGSASSNTTAPFLTPECQPQKSNLVLKPLCSSNKAVVDISWPYSIDAANYEIYRNGTLVKTAGQSIDPNLRKWTDDNAGAGLTDSTGYTYYIKSISSGGVISQSFDRTVTTSYCAVLNAPTGLNASFSCNGTPPSTPRVSLSWNAVVGATSYDIYRNGLFLVNKTVLLHEDTTVTVNTLYDYTVRAKNAGGESADSVIASIPSGQYCTPQKPIINISAGCSGGNPANNINWSGEAYPNTSVYKIYRGSVNNFSDVGTVLIGTIDKATQPAAFAARVLIDNPSSPRLEDEAAYYYWVQAIGPAPEYYTTLSDGTNMVNLFCGPPEATDTLAGSFLCSGTPPSNPYAHLSWNAIGHATSYDIYRNGSFLINVTSLTHDDSTISVDTAYNYTVRGRNANGQGTDSNVISIGLGNYCTPSVPAINPVSTVCEGNQSKNTVSWADATSFNTANFEIYRSTDNATISNFESATFTPPGWITGGNANWFRDVTASSEGIASAASGAIGNSQLTFIDYDITVNSPSALRFYWKVSSENNYDFLLFCLDSDGCTRTSGYRNRISGTSMTSFKEVTVPITAGIHSFRWVYAKDGSAIGGSDRAWIDNVRIASIDSASSLGTVDKSVLTWTDSGSLAPLMDYLYWIKAIGPTGLSSVSASPIKTLSCGVMPPVANLDASFACDGSSPYAVLGWDSVPFATSYNIYRNESYLTSRTTNAYNDLGITVNTTYSYFVKAENDSGEGDSSNVSSIALGNYCVPFTPVIDPIATDCSSEKPINAISWSDDFPASVQRYEIYRNTVGNLATATLKKTLDKSIPEDVLGFNSRTWTDNPSELQDLTTYYYWIKSIGPTDLSSSSNSRSATTLFCGVPEASILSLGSTYCDTNMSYADLSWTASANAYSYDLYRNNITDSIQSVYSTVLSPLTDGGSKSLRFDGLRGYSYVKNGISTNKGITVEAWINPDNLTTYQSIFIAGYQSGTNGNGWFFVSPWSIDWQYASGASVKWPTIPTSWNWGQWYHVVVTQDYVNNEVKFYRDGMQMGSTYAYGDGEVPIIDEPVYIGSYNYAQHLFKGQIDEVRVYDRVLDASEINEHKQNIYKNELGLLGAWHFDEKEGTKIIDSSGQGNNGKIAGPEWSIGKYDKGIDLGGLNGYVNVPRTSSIDIVNKITLEAWIKPGVVENCEWIINKKDGGWTSSGYALEICNSNNIRLLSSGGDNAASYSWAWDNNWHHLAGVIDGNIGKIYLDGVDVTSDSSISLLTSSASDLRIGNRENYNYFDGIIDEVRIYNRALNSAEIMEHKNGTFNNNSGLVEFLNFNKGSGLLAYDKSGNGNDGNLIRGAYRKNESSAVLGAFQLESNKDYKYTVKALGVGTEGALSNEVSITAPDCLPVQADLTLTPGCDVSGNQIVLSWSPDPNTSYWTIYRKRTSELDTSFISITETTLNSYPDVGVESNASYDYYVEAYGSSSSAISDVKTAVAPVCFDIPVTPIVNRDSGYVCGGAPPASTDNTVFPKCAGSASRMEINWDPYDDSKTFSYNILRKNVSAGEVDFTVIRANLPYLARSYMDGNINSAENYIYKIEAVGSGVSNSVLSDESLQILSCDCANLVPYVPPWLSLVSANYTLSSGGDVEINWTDAQNETSYQIFRRLQDGEFAYVGNTDVSKNIFRSFINSASAADTYLSPLGTMVAGTNYADPAPTGYVTFNDLTAEEDETYEYRVRALNAAGSTDSNIISPVYVPIAPPGNFTLSSQSLPSSVRLSWTAAAYSEKGGPPRYTVYRSATSDFSSEEVICADVQDFPINVINRICIDNDPLPGLSYYRARASNNSPLSTDSNTVIIISSLKWDETTP